MQTKYRVPQGRITEDGDYEWHCDRPLTNHENCPYCCGLDEEKLLKSIATAKGQVYYGNMKAYLSIKGKTIVTITLSLIAVHNSLSLDMIMSLIDYLNFPRNRSVIIFDWLEENRILSSGTYSNLKDRGFKPTKVIVSKDYVAELKGVSNENR